jgi:MSHA pilin protein MshC
MFVVSSKEHGFSLVELVLTIVILGVIAAVAIPKFFNRVTFDERYYADDILSAVRYAQRLATGSGCSVQLNVSAAGFSLFQDANCLLGASSFTLTVPRPNDSEAFSNFNVPGSITITSSDTAYIFTPASTVLDTGGGNVGNANITLTGEITRSISIEGTTGYGYQN